MKFFIFFIPLILCSCDLDWDWERKSQVIEGVNLTNHELNSVPYQVNNTFSFKNQNGEVLNYICNRRDHYRDQNTANTCGHDAMVCPSVYNYDHLDINLKCITNSKYDMEIALTGETPTKWRFFFKNSPSPNYIGDITPGTQCKLLPAKYDHFEVSCLDSVVINNKKYFHVSKITNEIDSGNQTDTIYYNKNFGFLKLCFDNEIWIKQ